MNTMIPAVAAVFLFSLNAAAQHPGHAPAPYAGQQARTVKALSEDEVKGFLEGAGMGFAKAAELNRYPGPMHVLENADELMRRSIRSSPKSPPRRAPHPPCLPTTRDPRNARRLRSVPFGSS